MESIVGFVYVFHGDWGGSLICSLLLHHQCGVVQVAETAAENSPMG